MKAETIFDVKGQITLVTGAASGLGLAMAEVMADNGAHVVMADIDPANLESESARLRQKGGSVEALLLDVGDIDKLARSIDGIVEKHGRLDAVFANAGITSGPGFYLPEWRIEVYPLEKWQEVLHINMTSIFVTLRTAAGHMKKQRSGRIVVTASIAGLKADTHVGYAYVATKAAVINLVRQTAMELAPFGVSVNAIAPGPFLTNIAGGRLKRDPEVAKDFAKMVPMGRLGDTKEMQGLALMLASPAASFITGTVIPIDGGSSAALPH
jgi:NAD(P)-dependent dehydrogenase (short-subunit alcohol dehydrogenase family)